MKAEEARKLALSHPSHNIDYVHELELICQKIKETASAGGFSIIHETTITDNVVADKLCKQIMQLGYKCWEHQVTKFTWANGTKVVGHNFFIRWS